MKLNSMHIEGEKEFDNWLSVLMSSRMIGTRIMHDDAILDFSGQSVHDFFGVINERGTILKKNNYHYKHGNMLPAAIPTTVGAELCTYFWKWNKERKICMNKSSIRVRGSLIQ